MLSCDCDDCIIEIRNVLGKFYRYDTYEYLQCAKEQSKQKMCAAQLFITTTTCQVAVLMSFSIVLSVTGPQSLQATSLSDNQPVWRTVPGQLNGQIQHPDQHQHLLLTNICD